jgi:hypothetical protein
MLLVVTKDANHIKSAQRTMKTTTIKNLTALAALGLVLSGVSARAQYSDDFEGSTLNPFWATELHSGYVTCPSSARAHSGSHSVELVTTDTGGWKNVRIYHSFAAPTYGTVSFWVYDTGADVYSANSITFQVSRAFSMVANIWTADYDLGSGQDGSTYNYGATNLPSGASSGIDRSQAWHQFIISCLPNALTIRIDGTLIYTGSGGQTFDRVDMILGAPSWRPAWSVQFDDFQFTPDPGLDLHMYAGLTLSGTVGRTYEIQYSTNLNGPTWQPLADITLASSPCFYFDTNSASATKRFYRAVLMP